MTIGSNPEANPKANPESNVDTTHRPELVLDLDQPAVQYAGFWIRFVAFIIDSIMVSLLLAIPFALMFDQSTLTLDVSGSLSQQMEQLVPVLQQFLVKNSVMLVLYVFCWMKFLGTPGKLLLGTHIVDARTFGPLTLGQSLIRYLGYFVSTFALCLGFVWVGIDPKKQGFHDMMAGSVVIYKPKVKAK